MDEETFSQWYNGIEVIMVRTLDRQLFIQTIRDLILEAQFHLPAEVIRKLEEGKAKETGIGKNILSLILENREIAADQHIPLCQDTGVVVVRIEIGNEVYVPFLIQDAVDEAVRISYEEGYLRKSVVDHPFTRKNTRDNTPAIVHVTQILGEDVILHVAPKGAGSENMSRLSMLTPSSGKEGVVAFVLETIRLAGGKACPPIIVGIGLGGNFERCAELAKEALFRPLSDESPNPVDRALEQELVESINALGVGPMGLGGATTCLSVKVNSAPCHIASLPIAVNIQCHSARKGERRI
ncbi:MAG: fumarate hydratase [Candidatus Izemoplasmatales bacterium]